MDGAEHPRQGGRHENWVSFILPYAVFSYIYIDMNGMFPSGTKSLTTGFLSFVSRANPKTNDKHVILGVIGWKPRDFANQMNLSLSNGWGIVRTIADMCLKREAPDGKFVLVKDPNKSILRLYEVPAGSFDEDGEDDGVGATVATAD